MDREPKLGFPFNEQELIWKPPEVREFHSLQVHSRVRSESQTKACNMYAVAVIFFEILTFLSAEKALNLVEVGSRRLSDAQLCSSAMPPQLEKLLVSCLGPRDGRPRSQQFINQFQQINKRRTNIVEHILQRMKVQTAELERVVSERSHLLEAEMKKADMLLTELFPS
jgi:hypothetical protein